MTILDLPIGRTTARLRNVRRAVSTGLAWALFGVGWTLAKACRLLLTGLTAVLFAAGWMAGRVVWPALVWSATAVRLGWEEGRKPIGGRRGPA